MASLRKRAILAGSILVLAVVGGVALARTPSLHVHPAATVLATDAPQAQPGEKPDAEEAADPAEPNEPDGPNHDVEANDGDH